MLHSADSLSQILGLKEKNLGLGDVLFLNLP